jgi:hypothetical protein
LPLQAYRLHFAESQLGFPLFFWWSEMSDNQNGLNGGPQENIDQGSNTKVVQPSESDLPKQAGRKPHTRTDKNGKHAGHGGALSKYPEEALTRRGESVRQLRDIKRKFRGELQPPGILGNILFDRAWSCYLRLKLIAPADGSILAPENNPANRAKSTPRLREDHFPTLVFENNETTRHLSPELLGHLAVLQRYDSHFSREFFRAIGTLLSLRTNSKRGPVLGMQETLGHDVLGDEDAE